MLQCHPDHYLPLLYVLGLRRAGEQISFPVEGSMVARSHAHHPNRLNLSSDSIDR